MNIVFFGTSSFATPPLEAMVRGGFPPALVVTQHARPAGRGQKVQTSPVARVAEQAALPLIDPEDVSSPSAMEEIASRAPDLFVVVAYGQKLTDALLALPKLGAYNIHGSLLPLLRGAAPIQRAVMQGFRESGVTILQINSRMDAGPVVAQRATPIGADETAGELHDRLAVLGAELLTATLPLIQSGRAPAIPQDDSRATRARKLTKEEGHVPFDLPAQEVAWRVRGLTPWPGAHCFHSPPGKEARRLVLRRVRARDGGAARPPGTVLTLRPDIEVACSSGTLAILELMREGRAQLGAQEFLRGYPLAIGDVLT